MRVHHLLTHTSGLRDEDVTHHAAKKRGVVAIPPPEETQHPWINEYLFLRYDAPLWKPPGVEMSYCSYGYNLLGEIVRRVSGQALADFARDRIFEPLGMQDTFYSVPDAVRARIVRRPLDAPFAATTLMGLPGTEPENIRSCLWPVMVSIRPRWTWRYSARCSSIVGATGRRILSPAAVAEMTRNQIPGIGAQHRGEIFLKPHGGLAGVSMGIKEPCEGIAAFAASI